MSQSIFSLISEAEDILVTLNDLKDKALDNFKKNKKKASELLIEISSSELEVEKLKTELEKTLARSEF